MKVFISADIEGVAGVTAWHQCVPGEDDYAVGRRLMIEEVNAAVSGAFDGGATTVIVNDAHHRMTNLVPDEMDPRARLILGPHKPLYMMQGIGEDVNAAFFVGYHGAIGAPQAVLSHSYNPSVIWEARVNGRVVGELGINLLVCEYFGVPLVLATGDQVTTAEAREAVPTIHVAQVKESFSRTSAESLSPLEARALIRREAQKSLQSLPSLEPARREATIDLTFQLADMADVAAWLPGVERTGDRGVRFKAPDGLAAYRSFYAVLMLTRNISA